MPPPDASVAAALTWHQRFHVGVMFGLYASQGFLQGLCQTITALLLAARPDTTLAETAAISGCLVAFAFKFLWAPLVDGVWFRQRTRRPLWIVTFQVLLLCVFGRLWTRADDLMLKANFDELVLLMYAAAFLSATQDIAVDAWAVEGLPARLGSVQSSVQTVGLLTGIGLTQLAAVTVGWGWASVAGLLGGIAAIYATVLVAVVVYLQTPACATALDLAEEVSAGSPAPTCAAVINEVVSLVRDHAWCRYLCLVLLLRTIHVAGETVMSVQAVKLLSFESLFFTELALALMPVSIGISIVASSALAKRPVAGRLNAWVHILKLELFVAVLTLLAYPLLDGQSPLSRGAARGLGVVSQIVGGAHFTIGGSVIGLAARRAPGSVGSALTLLQSLSNFSFKATSTVAALTLAWLIPEGTERAESFLGFERHTTAFATVAGGAIVASLLVQRVIIAPALTKHVAPALKDKDGSSA